MIEEYIDIEIDEETLNLLDTLKQEGESYDDVIRKILEAKLYDR